MQTMNDESVALTVDARGLSCPMPIVRARKAIDEIAVGEIMEVLVTDRGSPADFRAWCQQTEQKFLTEEKAGEHTRLLIKKLVPETKEKNRQFRQEMSNAELACRLEAGEELLLIDVREPEEYAAGHIPGAKSLPIGRIDEASALFSPEQEVMVVCRSGRRSDYACQILQKQGFQNVHNVVPGMSGWSGPIAKEGGAAQA